jgi:hypothetical protein
MGNEGSYTALGLKVWKAQVDRADKLFGTLSSEQILQEIAPGRNRLLYLWGASDSHTRRDAAAAGAGKTKLSRV